MPTAHFYCCMKTKMQKRKNIKKIISSETICSMGLRICRNFHHISLYRFYENFLFGLVVMATQIFHRFLMEKIEKWHLLPSSFDITFTAEMFLEYPCIIHMIVTHSSFYIGCRGNQNAKKKFISSDALFLMKLWNHPSY